MRKSLAFILCVALAGMLCGCDDHDAHKPRAKSAHIAESGATRAGPGWRTVATERNSRWRFADARSSTATAGQPPDSLDMIGAALAARMLPPRDSVRIADLIGGITRPTSLTDGARPGDSGERYQAFVTTSPWNDHTWLLWVSVSGLDPAGGQAISVDFDPKTVASFRPLGDPGALPDLRGAGGGARMLYELSPEPDGPQSPDAVYAVLHVGGADPSHPVAWPIGPANFIDSIDNAPDVVRFATAVAGFAELLRGDPAVRDLSCAEMIALAEGASQPDPDGVRARAIDLMRRAEPLIDQPPGDPEPAAEVEQR
jgi:hypothetical protein